MKALRIILKSEGRLIGIYTMASDRNWLLCKIPVDGLLRHTLRRRERKDNRKKEASEIVRRALQQVRSRFCFFFQMSIPLC